MITKVVAQLKTGSVKNVYSYGYKPAIPEPPYTIVKPERDPINRGRGFRIIAHFLPGQIIMLEDYVFNEVSNLLSDFSTTSRHGNYNMLLSEDDYSDIIARNDDGTISMERVFLMPSRLF